MLADKLKNHTIILASNSPRRKQFLLEMGVPFEVKTKNVEEVYPTELIREEITDFLAKLKAAPLRDELNENDILITSDTIVWLQDKALGKPADYDEAFQMIKSLSGTKHEVVSSVCVTTPFTQLVQNCVTEVTFKALQDDEIHYYIDNFKPYDKAGAYGIQEWIGYIGITAIKGSYNNVVGLPTHLFYEMLDAVLV